MLKTILAEIKLYDIKIARWEKEIETLDSWQAWLQVDRERWLDKFGKWYRIFRQRIKDNELERQRLIEIIEAHPDKMQREILKQRYIDGHSMQEIADRLSYSERHTARECARAIETINKQYPPE